MRSPPAEAAGDGERWGRASAGTGLRGVEQVLMCGLGTGRRCWERRTSAGLQGAKPELRGVSPELQAASLELQGASPGLQAMSPKLQKPSVWQRPALAGPRAGTCPGGEPILAQPLVPTAPFSHRP